MLFCLSCQKFLDVKPKDLFLKEDILKDRYALYNALNGVYLGLSHQNLYGEQLSMTTVDVLGQYYKNNSSDWSSVSNFNYSESSAMLKFDAIWSRAYTSIMNINSFIDAVGKSTSDIKQSDKDILLGEAYGLRAYLHFDLLRLYGPVYSTNKSKEAIPYMSESTMQLQSIKTAEEVMNDVLKDINNSIDLLQNDPVVSHGVDYTLTNDVALDFFKMRNRRFNYYAAQCLKARILLYAGDKVGANIASVKAIDEASKWFKWSPATQSMPNITNPDRVFSSEIIFGIDNYSMYDVYQSYFDVVNTEQEILAPLPDRLTEVFAGNENDYRFRVNWVSGASGGKAYRVFIKYKDVLDRNLYYRNFQPMIRLSEMYLIAAESSNSDVEAMRYLNELYRNRGIAEITVMGNKMDLIFKEYRKEFWGEGQMFFFYKRNFYPLIGNGKSSSNVRMDETKYKVPLPNSEVLIRQN